LEWADRRDAMARPGVFQRAGNIVIFDAAGKDVSHCSRSEERLDCRQDTESEASMISERQRQAQTKAYTRSIVAIALIAAWSVMLLTGLLLYVAPSGQRSGRLPILLLTKETWGDIHFWIGVAAILITVAHVIIDWRALRGCLRYLTSADRSRPPRD
jgi:hypothetical protein